MWLTLEHVDNTDCLNQECLSIKPPFRWKLFKYATPILSDVLP